MTFNQGAALQSEHEIQGFSKGLLDFFSQAPIIKFIRVLVGPEFFLLIMYSFLSLLTKVKLLSLLIISKHFKIFVSRL